MVTTFEPPQVRSSTGERVLVLALGCAMVHGTVNRGGFYAGDAAVLLALLFAAGAVRTVRHLAARRVATAARRVATAAGPPAVDRTPALACTALLGFAVWAAGSALLRGDGAAGLPDAALACGLAAAAWAASGLDASGRRVLHAVVIACGLTVAATGWAGVALHSEPLALVSSGLWRASSTLTYANAAAAFLVTALLLAMAVLPAVLPAVRPAGTPRGRGLLSRPGLPTQVVVFALLLGLVATMSRAGLLALAAGAAVLLASAPHRARLRTLWPVLPAVAVAAAGLLPALPQDAGPRPLPALAGLACGVAILFLDRRVVALLVAAAALAVALMVPAATFAELAGTRLSATSAERGDLTRVTAAQFLGSPLAGTGPGRLDLVYLDHRGVLVSAEYTHDEYLQVAAETGVVGLLLVLAAVAALTRAALRRWRAPTGPPVLAVLTAFALHSGADFLWHIPVLPLLVIVVTVPLLTQQTEEP